MHPEQEIKPIEIKDLNKTQLILLAFLLSFVTSVATGIVTVTLMDQAPAAVSQTINRVVQQTVEKVVPGSSKVQTVVVKEDDLVVDAVTKTRENIYGLYDAVDGTQYGSAYSLGGGLFAASWGDIERGKQYTVKKDGAVLAAKVLPVSEVGFTFLSASNAAGDEKRAPKISAGTDADAKPGSTVVAVGAENVSKGIVQSIVKQTSERDVTRSWNAVLTSLVLSEVPYGTAVVNLDGSVIGFRTSTAKGAQIVGIDAVMQLAAEAEKAALAEAAN